MGALSKSPSVSNLERELVFKVANGHSDAFVYIHSYRNLCAEAKDLNYISGLRWLISQRLTGSDFISWLREKHQGSVLLASAEIRKKSQSEFKTRKIYARRPA